MSTTAHKNFATAPTALALGALTLALVCLGVTHAAAQTQTPAQTPTPESSPVPVASPSPSLAPVATPAPCDMAESPRGVSDLLVLQFHGRTIALLVHDKSAKIYSRELADQERGRIGLDGFKTFHCLSGFDKPSSLAYRAGKILVADKDNDALLEVDMATRDERVLLRKGDAGGFEAPVSLATSMRGAVAVGSNKADKVWVRPAGSSQGAFVGIPVARGTRPMRLFFARSDLHLVSNDGEMYRVANAELAPAEGAAFQKVPTGFSEPNDIVYRGDLLFAVVEEQVWAQPYAPGTVRANDAPGPWRAARLGRDAEYELSRLAVTDDRVVAVDAEGTSINVFARPPSVGRMRLAGDHLYWLEPFTNAIYRRPRPAPPQAAGEKLWPGERLVDAASITTQIADGGAVTIYGVDRGARSIFSLSNDRELSVVYQGDLLKEPVDIASADGILYVLDAGKRKLLSFNPALKEVVEEFSYDKGAMPDRLRYHKGNLLAFASEENVLDRFATVGHQHEPARAEWHMADDEHRSVKRGQRFQLQKALRGVSDFDLLDNIAYFLDVGQERLVLLPLESGSEPTEVAYDRLAFKPTGIVTDEKEMFLVDGHRRRFYRAPSILPVNVDVEGKWRPFRLLNLYRYLSDQRLLTTRRVTLSEPTTLAALALEVVPTGEGVADFRKFFCDLNDRVCDEWKSQPQPASEGGEVIAAGAVVTLPALRLDPYATQRPITLPLDTTISYQSAFFKKYINGPLGDLAREFLPQGVGSEEVSRLLRELNRDYVGPDITTATKGDFVIPIRATRAFAVAPRADVLNPNSRLSKLAREDNVTAYSPALSPLPQAARSAQAPGPGVARTAAEARPAPPADERCRQVVPALISDALDVVNYCFPSDLLRPGSPPPPEVGVIDNNFNPRHPAFAADQVRVYTDRRATVKEESLVEDEDPNGGRPEESTTFMELDHGTHMAALIGAGEHAGEMMGVYPQTQIIAIPVASQFKGVVRQYRSLSLFNLSLGEKPGTQVNAPGGLFVETRPVIDFITTHPHPLFVVAAGNDAQKIREKTLASYGYLDNVLVVGATNTPTLDRETRSRPPASRWVKSKDFGSSYDDKLVGLAAPGEGIKSALYNKKYGTADGTSPATAIVTGAAAILMNVEPSWKAWQIKARLIATADLWTDRELKKNLFANFLSGILNIRRAVLDTKVAVYDHQTNGVCRGRIPIGELDKKLIISQPGGKSPLEIKLRHLLRVARSGDSKYTIIYYETKRLDNGKGPVNYVLERALDVETFDMEDGYSFNFTLSNPGGNCRENTLDLRTVKDFVNTFNLGPEEVNRTPGTEQQSQ